jgi:glucosamine--fructose-6-phosphate aminotransferase (isomerizing)
MCGIVAVVRRPGSRAVPDLGALTSQLADAVALLGPTLESAEPPDVVRAVQRAAGGVEAVDRELRGTAGLRALLAAPVDDVDGLAGELEAGIARIERFLDAEGARFGSRIEAVNASLEQLKDSVWAVRHDRLPTARAVAALTGPEPSVAAIEACASIQIALSALDRLEVRGRDSAGVHVTVEGHGLDLDAPAVRAQLSERASDRLFRSTAVRLSDGHLCFVYKAAAEIGELGDNTRAIRQAIVSDELLRTALRHDDAQATVLAHTRWASVGIISEANAHPVNQEEDGRDGPYVVAALNGDVDNYAQLRDATGLRVPPEFTTDAKVIPALVSRRLADEPDLAEAFRRTVASFDGSVAIAAGSTKAPGQVLLALRGSGQALYVGLAEDAYVVASEPYGLVEETSTYLRMDGETSPGASAPGQIVVLDRAGAGTAEGIRRFAYDGTPLPVHDGDLTTATITTRDIDRGEFPHFLLKELSESPQSFRKTLRGRIEEHNGRLAVALGPEALPDAIVERLRDRTIRRVLVIGQVRRSPRRSTARSARRGCASARSPQPSCRASRSTTTCPMSWWSR